MKLLTVISACTIIATIPLTSYAELNNDGNWAVKRGDSLYNIARRVAPGNSKEQARIRKYMFSENPSAFKNNDPGSLEIGKVLSLPGTVPTTSKPTPKPKPKPVAKAAVIAAPAAIIAAPKASAPSAPAVNSSDGFKARIEAKRIAKEAADKKHAEAQRMAAEKQAQANAAALKEKSERQAAEKLAVEKQAAANAAAQKKAAAEAAAKAAQKKVTAAAPKPAAPAPISSNATDTINPYIECKTTNPSEKCGTWRTNYKGK